MIDDMNRDLFSGTYQVRVAGFRVSRNAVAATLPEQLILDRKRKNVRMFLLCGQQAVQMNYSPLAVVYEEAIFAIPGVRLRANPSAGLFTYMPKVFVSDTIPLVVNTMFGFRKELARFRTTDTGVEIRALLSGELRLRFTYEDESMARGWKWYRELKRRTWRLPTLNIVAGQVLEADARIHPGEMVQPSRMQMQFDIPEMDYLPERKKVKPIAKDTLGGFLTVQNYDFNPAHRLPFNRLIL